MSPNNTLDIGKLGIVLVAIILLWALVVGFLFAAIAQLMEVWQRRRAKKRAMKLVGHINTNPFPRIAKDSTTYCHFEPPKE